MGSNPEKATLLVRIVATLALLLSGRTQPVTAQDTAQQITINALGGEPSSIDPSRITFATEAAIVRQVFEPLLRFDADLMPQPAAAERFSVSPDGLEYTFYLRPDGYWSDGVVVSARHFEYSWQRLLDPTTGGSYASFFVDAGVDSVTALDDRTLEIRLSHPFGPLPNLAALPVVSPLRPDLVEPNPGWALEPATYLGNGPFMLSEWEHQDHITLIRNPYYVAHLQWPVPTLERITLSMLTDGDKDYAAFLNGERDWTVSPASTVAAALAQPELAQQARRYTQLAIDWLQLNNGRKPLDNVLVRRALSKAIDRAALIRQVIGGVGLPTTSLLPPGMPGFQQRLGRELEFDPEGARSLLAQAGFPDGRGFPRLAFTFQGTSEQRARVEFMRAQWRQHLNIDVELNALQKQPFHQAVNNKDFDIAFTGWIADYPDPQNWFSASFGCKGTINTINYCNQAFDELVMRADQGVELDDRLALYNEAQSLLIQDAPFIPLYVSAGVAVIKPYVEMVDGSPLRITGADDYPGDFFLDMVRIMPH